MSSSICVKAILIGSIGVVAETSDIQRRAYNTALRAAGLDWDWDVSTYKELLKHNGGKARLRRLRDQKEASLSDTELSDIHEMKTRIACEQIRRKGVSLRPGFRALIDLAKAAGVPVGFVTTTYRPNIDAIFDGSDPALREQDFAFITTTDDVTRTKPDPEVYRLALDRLGLSPDNVLAIEDSETSLAAAKAAGLTCLATPGAFTADQDFSRADWHADTIDAFLAAQPLMFETA